MITAGYDVKNAFFTIEKDGKKGLLAAFLAKDGNVPSILRVLRLQGLCISTEEWLELIGERKIHVKVQE